MAKKPRKHKKLQDTRTALTQARYGTLDPEVILDIDTSSDEKYLRNANIRWEELEEIDRNLAINSARVANELIKVMENREVIDNLGDRKELFNRAVMQFKKDFVNFSEGLERLKDKWEGKTGQVLTMDDLNLYNNLSAAYNDLNTQFISFSQLSASTITMEAMEVLERLHQVKSDEENNIEEGEFTEIVSKEELEAHKEQVDEQSRQ